MNTQENQQVGHTFLASLGKTKLRPGGVEATNWLIEQANLNNHSKVLEVACNMATTAIELASKYGCSIIAIDMNDGALTKAKTNVENAGLTDKINIQKANANKLPYEDNSFDIVINEAMLTMYEDKAKTKLVEEYYRVLKPNGLLLTHDIMINVDPKSEKQNLKEVVKTNVSPMPLEKWVELFKNVGFSEVKNKHGKMSLLSPTGLIRDEGMIGTLKILKNAFKNKANRTRFLKMFKFFRENRNKMFYIAVCSKK